MIRLLQECRDVMIERARADAPNETCGFLTGRDGVIRESLALRNVAAEPRTRYEFEPLEHFKFLKRMEREGVPILGVYHSHPASVAYPSVTDVARATLPDGTPTYAEYIYIILSLASPGSPVLRAFRIQQGGEIEEEEIVIVPTRP